MSYSRANIAPQRGLSPYKANSKGFSLVEVTLAVGIVSFVFLTILGLLPTGLRTFTSAIESSVGGQILQRVINEAQQTDFDTLVSVAPTERYFDDQGNECVAGGAIYHVNTRITAATALTSTNASAATNASLATITLQIAKKPGNLTLAKTNNLWPTTTARAEFDFHAADLK